MDGRNSEDLPLTGADSCLPEEKRVRKSKYRFLVLYSICKKYLERQELTSYTNYATRWLEEQFPDDTGAKPLLPHL